MQKDRLEEKLRKSLGEYPSPMDLEGAWSQLERTRNKKKRRGAWFWWIGGVGVLVATLGLALIKPWGNNSSETLATPTKKIEETESADTKAPEQIATITLSDDKIAKEMPIVLRSVVVSEKPLETANLTEKSGPISGLEHNLRLESTSAEQSVKSADLADSHSIEEGKRIGANSLKAADRQRQNALPSIKITPSIHFDQDHFDALPLASRNYRRKKQKQEGLWIGFSSTLGIQDRNLGSTASATTETETLLTRRNETEESLEAYSFSFDIRRDFRAGWYLQTGLRHQIGFEHFEDQYERTFDKILEDQVTEIIQRADGSITELRGTVTVPVTESVQSSIYNTQNLTEIPILLGYQQPLTDRVGVDLNAGILYGLIQRKEGQIHSLATEPGQYQSLSQLPYRRSNIWGGQLQGTISYQIGNQWVAFGGIQAKRYANLVLADETFFERQLVLNAVLGIRLKLQ